MSYDDRTKDELQDELRDRGLPVSGNKSELVERLEADDEEAESSDDPEHDDDSPDGGDRDSGEAGSDSGGGADGQRSGEGGTGTGSGGTSRGGLRPKQVVQQAVRHLAELSGRKVEGVAGFERIGDGWRVHLETVEVHRVPSSTDVLGTYEVEVDEDGELLSYSRVRRYMRGATSGEDDG